MILKKNEEKFLDKSLQATLISSFRNEMRERIEKKINNTELETKYSQLDALVDELAEIKAELFKTSIEYQQITGIELLKSIKYSSFPGISDFPVFSAGSKFDVCSEVVAFNMHSPIKTKQNRLVRWSGPEIIFGFLVRIDRSEDLLVSIPILSKAGSKTKIDMIEIDGNPVQISYEGRSTKFNIAKRENNSLGDITNFTFRAAPTASTGETSVGVCLKYVELRNL